MASLTRHPATGQLSAAVAVGARRAGRGRAGAGRGGSPGWRYLAVLVHVLAMGLAGRAPTTLGPAGRGDAHCGRR